MLFLVKEKLSVHLPARLTWAISILGKNSTKKVGRDILRLNGSTWAGGVAREEFGYAHAHTVTNARIGEQALTSRIVWAVTIAT